MSRPEWMNREWWSRSAVADRLYDEHGRRYTWRDISPASIGALGVTFMVLAQVLRLAGIG
jgi:hypothetical protein